MILAGHGTLWAQAWDELLEFAELAGVPVMTTMAAKSVFPEDHELSLGTGGHTGTLMAARYLERADLVVGIGTSLTRSVFDAPLPPTAAVAQVTNCPEDLNKDYVLAYGALGDARLVLGQMTEEVRRQGGAQGRDSRAVVERVAGLRAEFEAQWSPLWHSDEVPINPYRVFTELAAAVPAAEAIVTHDSGYPRDQLLPMWKAVRPRGYLGWGKSTQLGYGLGLALGAKLAAPDKTVVNVMGDAAFGMAGMDLETAVRAEIPILTIVLNNGVMTHYDKNLPDAARLHDVHRLGGCYSGVARELGAHAERVEQPEAVRSALERAVASTREGVPAVVEVMTKAEETVASYW
jgi:acetolactate synthase-1/2/3 large subunit